MVRKSDRIDELYHALALAISRLEHFWACEDPLGIACGSFYLDEIEWLYRVLHGEELPKDARDMLSQFRKQA